MQRDLKHTKDRFSGVMSIPVTSVVPNPRQPRNTFDNQALDALADSIRQVGLLQPISVRQLEGKRFELIAGERRLRACRQLGFVYIDALVVTASATRSALLALVENLQREDLHFLDEAEGYENVLHESQMTQEWLAIRIGKSQSAIANKLRILKLSPEVRDALRRTKLTERHARALLRLPHDALQMEALGRMVSQKLNVSQADTLVTSMLAVAPDPKPPAARKVFSIIRDHRLYVNAISDVVRQMQMVGIDADSEVREGDGSIEIVVRVPTRKKAPAIPAGIGAACE